MAADLRERKFMNKLFLGCLLGSQILQIIVATASIGAGESKPAWQVEWEKTVEAAKREGQVTVYMWGNTAPLDAGVFQRRYGIKVVGVAVRKIHQMTLRIFKERRAGKYLVDVVTHAIHPNVTFFYLAKVLDPVKRALIHPEVVDESKWWQGRHRYADPEGQYVFVYAGRPQYGWIYYNTKLMNPNEFNSVWDFLNPKWKGKIESLDLNYWLRGQYSPLIAHYDAARNFYYNPKLGPKFISRLFSDMSMTVFRNPRSGLDRLIKGKFALCFFCSGVGRAKRQGLPVDSFAFRKDGAGIVAKGHTLGLVNRAPHPNAAKVFINWFLSREGQITLQKTYGKAPPNSRRTDIPKDDILLRDRLVEGVDYFDLSIRRRIFIKPVLKIYKEALAKAR